MEQPDPQKNKTSRTIYDAKPGEIFWKNFLAGLGHGVGNVLIYIIFSAIIAWGIISFAMPRLSSFFNNYINLFNPQNSKTNTNNNLFNNFDFNNLLGK